MAQDWDIKPRDSVCHQCHAPFEEGQICHSRLIFGEAGYVRTDMCDACRLEQPDDSTWSAWQGVYHAPPPPEEEALKKETAESILRRMMEDPEEGRRNVIFILAVMLERKKMLVEKDVRYRDDGTLVRLYEHRITGETFLVPDPQLNLDELDHVQTEVLAMLGGAPSAPRPHSSEPAPEQAPAPESKAVWPVAGS